MVDQGRRGAGRPQGPRIAAGIPGAQPDWAYFLDVDGTLIDIAEAPDAIHVDDALLGLVARLHRTCGGALALVSGRTLADLDDRLGSVRIPLAGQHGLERRDAAGRQQIHPAAILVLLFGLAPFEAWAAAALILLVIYGRRHVMLRATRHDLAAPLTWMAPRGLITVLLFLSAKESLSLPGFSTAR